MFADAHRMTVSIYINLCSQRLIEFSGGTVATGALENFQLQQIRILMEIGDQL